MGDSSTNIITPLMPYFPLIVAFCRRYLGSAGIGTLAAMMLPYSVLLLTGWSLLLLAFWAFGLPLGIRPAIAIRADAIRRANPAGRESSGACLDGQRRLGKTRPAR